MKVLSLISQKGGVGKTTLATALAVAATQDGKRVVMMDLDPQASATFWMDNVCIPAKSRNVENAYKFLNYIMEGKVNAEIVNGVSYASANVPARQFINPDILNDAAIYPSDEVIARCEFLEDIGDTTTLLDEYWTEIKAQ